MQPFYFLLLQELTLRINSVSVKYVGVVFFLERKAFLKNYNDFQFICYADW